MRFTIKKSLFGYNCKQVVLCLDDLDNQLKQQQEEYEARIKQVVAENINLSVDLKVARSGYKDSAELMMAAQSRVRDLERYLEVERQRVALLEQQQIKIKQSKPEEPVIEYVKLLQERIAALETLQILLAKAEERNDKTIFEALAFDYPEGFEISKEKTDDARGLMQRLYHMRSAEQET
jgi:hypothetical protein